MDIMLIVVLFFAIDLLRNARTPFYTGLIVLSSLTIGFAMQAWLYEGCLMPFNTISLSIH